MTISLKINEKKKNNATICLNMIVKDEEHIIEKTLIHLTSKIHFDYWVICDTGSTDNTPKIICDFFKKINIPGELIHHKWKNFAYNRTKALQCAFSKTDLLLVFDADDEIIGNINIPKNVEYDQYHLQFGDSNGITYTRILLINNRKKFAYLSVLHEFIVCLEENHTNTNLTGDYFIVSGRTGSRNKNPNKYLDDAKLLEKAHKEALENNDFLYTRYAFYCGNSYRDFGDYENAIKWYKITLNQPNWDQEKYMCCIHLFECYQKLNQIENSLYYCMKSHDYDNERIEGIYEVIMHFCVNENFKMAYHFYLLIKEHYENSYFNDKFDNSNKLFLYRDKYNFFLPYYMIIVSHKINDFDCGIKMYEIIFKYKTIINNKFFVGNVLFNMQFFFKHVKDNNFFNRASDYINYLHNIGANLSSFDFLFDYSKVGINIDNIFPKKVIQKYHNFNYEQCNNCKNILIYVGFSNFNWNYSYSLKNSLGGSERAVIYLTKYFSKDYNIFICGDVEEENVENIHFINTKNIQSLINEKPFYSIIISRYIDFLELYQNISFSKCFVWCHDIHLMSIDHDKKTVNNGCNILYKWSHVIDNIICLTHWQKYEYINYYPFIKNKICIINNGIEKQLITNINNNNVNDTNNINNVNKVKNKFIYSSCAERGLKILLKLWDKILEKIPDAKLVICTYNEFPKNDEEKLMKKIINKYKKSITHFGKLNQKELYNLMASCEYCLYPCIWPETSCITALELLAHEVIVLHYSIAGLDETINNNGIIIENGNEIEKLMEIKDDEKRKNIIKTNGKKYALSSTWKNKAKIWSSLLDLTLTSNSTSTNGIIQIINLERRKDRKLVMLNQLINNNIINYNFFNATDSLTLESNENIYKLFEGNNFNYRKGVIACALSHINLFIKLINDVNNDFYVIMEDDAYFVPNFKEKLNKAIELFKNNNLYYLRLGYSFNQSSFNENVNELNIILDNDEKTLGGIGYIISKNAALKFIQYYDINPIKYAIDQSNLYTHLFDIYNLNQVIINNNVLSNIKNLKIIDSDIHNNNDCLIFNNNINSNSNNAEIYDPLNTFGFNLKINNNDTNIEKNKILNKEKNKILNEYKEFLIFLKNNKKFEPNIIFNIETNNTEIIFKEIWNNTKIIIYNIDITKEININSENFNYPDLINIDSIENYFKISKNTKIFNIINKAKYLIIKSPISDNNIEFLENNNWKLMKYINPIIYLSVIFDISIEGYYIFQNQQYNKNLNLEIEMDTENRTKTENIESLIIDRLRQLQNIDSNKIPQKHIDYLYYLKNEKKFKPRIIYDIGANVLNWTNEVKKIWNNSEIIVFDAIKEAEILYKEANVKYFIGLLSDEDNKLLKYYYNSFNPNGNSYYREIGSSLSNEYYPENQFEYKQSYTLSSIVKNNSFNYPDLIKIDVQGAELDILKGSMNIINKAKYLIIELQHEHYNLNAPLCYETILFLAKNGWKLIASKFCNNGPDADYCFENINFNIEYAFYISNRFLELTCIDYFDSINNDYPLIYTKDENIIMNYKPKYILFIWNRPNDIIRLYEHFKNSPTEFCIFNSEPLNIVDRFHELMNYSNYEKHSYSIFDYSLSNIKILKLNNIKNCFHLPYNIYEKENNMLISLNKNNEKIYDFGIIVPDYPITCIRRKNVVDFLIQNNFKVAILHYLWKEERDIILSKCKIILNIHGFYTTPSLIFEHMRCDRLLNAGYNILSEKSLFIEETNIEKFENIKFIDYDDFYNLNTYKTEWFVNKLK